MIVTHELTFNATCPVDGTKDHYTLIVRTDRMVKVEDILAAIKERTKDKVFQEDLTVQLWRDLGCEVETQGYHSGVRTTVVCGRES